MDSSGDDFLRHCSFCMKNFVDPVSAKQHFESRSHKKKEEAIRHSPFGESTKNTNSFTCHICSVTCNSAKSLEDHNASRRHKNMLLKNAIAGEVNQCDSKTINKVNEKKDGNLATNNDTSGRVQPNEASAGQQYDFDGEKGHCYVCKVDLNSVEQTIKHLNGSEHRNECSNVEGEGMKEQQPKAAEKDTENPKPKQSGNDDDDDILYCKLCDVRTDSLYTIIRHLKSVEHDTNVVNRSVNMFMSFSGLELGRKMRSNDSIMNAVFSSLHDSQPDQKQSAGQDKVLDDTAKQKWEVEHMTEKFMEMAKLQNKPEGLLNMKSANIAIASLLNEESSVAYRTAEETSKTEKQSTSKDGKTKVDQSVVNKESQAINQAYKPAAFKENDNTNRSQKLDNVDSALKNEGPEFTFDMASNKGHCYICNVDLSSKHVMQQHLNGRKHKNAKSTLQVLPSGSNENQMYDVCLVPITVEQMPDRNLGNNVKKTNNGKIDNSVKCFICVLCNIICVEEEECRYHLTDNTHTLRMKNFVAGMLPQCEICNHCVNTIEGLVSHQKELHPKKFVILTSDLQNYALSGGNAEQLSEGVETRPDAYVCEICEVDCKSENSYLEHCSGQKHRKKLAKIIAEDENAKMNLTYCVICEVECCSEENYAEHVLGQKHKKKVTKFQPDKPGIFFCEYCVIECYSENNLVQHLKGIKHRKNVIKAEQSILYCPLCCVECPSEDTYTIHLESEKHKDNLMKFQTDKFDVYCCDICKTEYDGENKLMQHLLDTEHSVNLKEKEDNTSGMIRCQLCNIECHNEASYQQHISGTKHRKKSAELQQLAQGNVFYCVLCEFQCENDETYTQHENEETHRQRVEEFECEIAGIFYCDACNVECSGEKNLMQHLLGEKHRKRMMFSENDSVSIFYCHFCNTDCAEENNYNRHLFGKNHKKTVAKFEDGRPDVFYCVVCQLDYEGEDNFREHIDGEDHKQKAYELTCESQTDNAKTDPQQNASEHESNTKSDTKQNASDRESDNTKLDTQQIACKHESNTKTDSQQNACKHENGVTNLDMEKEIKVHPGVEHSEILMKNLAMKMEVVDTKQSAIEDESGVSNTGLGHECDCAGNIQVKTEPFDEIQTDKENDIVNTDFNDDNDCADNVQVKKEIVDEIQNDINVEGDDTATNVKSGSKSDNSTLIKNENDDNLQSTADMFDMQTARNNTNSAVNACMNEVQTVLEDEICNVDAEVESHKNSAFNANVKKEIMDNIQTAIEQVSKVLNPGRERNSNSVIKDLIMKEIVDKIQYAVDNKGEALDTGLERTSDFVSNAVLNDDMLDKILSAMTDDDTFLKGVAFDNKLNDIEVECISKTTNLESNNNTAVMENDKLQESKTATNDDSRVIDANTECDLISNFHVRKKETTDKIESDIVDEQVLNGDLECGTDAASNDLLGKNMVEDIKPAVADVKGIENNAIENNNNLAFRALPEGIVFHEYESGQKDSGSAENDNMSAG